MELDPTVVEAATQAMGLPTSLPNLRLHCADGAAFLRERRQVQQAQQAQQPYDVLFMDTFDGEDEVPAALCTPGGRTWCLLESAGLHLRLCLRRHVPAVAPDWGQCCATAEFAADVAAALHPGHGCFLLNLHSLEEAHGQGRGGAAVSAFRKALLGSSSSSSTGSSGGSCFAVAAQRQRNVCVAIARGLALPADRSAARRWLLFEAGRVAEEAGFRFPAGSRACRNYTPLA